MCEGPILNCWESRIYSKRQTPTCFWRLLRSRFTLKRAMAHEMYNQRTRDAYVHINMQQHDTEPPRSLFLSHFDICIRLIHPSLTIISTQACTKHSKMTFISNNAHVHDQREKQFDLQTSERERDRKRAISFLCYALSFLTVSKWNETAGAGEAAKKRTNASPPKIVLQEFTKCITVLITVKKKKKKKCNRFLCECVSRMYVVCIYRPWLYLVGIIGVDGWFVIPALNRRFLDSEIDICITIVDSMYRDAWHEYTEHRKNVCTYS